MRNLHNIITKYTDEQVAHLWYYSQENYAIKLIDGIPYKKYMGAFGFDWDNSWWTDGVSGPYIMRVWKNKGKPMFDISKLES
jgi:hypothetical protein